MNLNYLIKEVLPQREKEIKQGKNRSTEHPIYVVLDLQEEYFWGHIDRELCLNKKNISSESGYIDADKSGSTFKKTDKNMSDPQEITKFYVDEIKAFFLTKKDALDYMRYQKHNLNKPYLYVFSGGYSNYHWKQLFS